MKTPPIQHAILLAKFSIIECDFKAPNILGANDLTDLSFDFKFGTGFKEDDNNKFIVSFIINIKSNKTEDFLLKVKADSLFTTDVEINDEFRTSNFAKINAPAIAFPFLRSFIQTFCVNAGCTPIILPAFNFANAIENNNKS